MYETVPRIAYYFDPKGYVRALRIASRQTALSHYARSKSNKVIGHVRSGVFTTPSPMFIAIIDLSDLHKAPIQNRRSFLEVAKEYRRLGISQCRIP